MKVKNSSILFIIPDFFFIDDYQRKIYCNDIPIGTLQLLSYLKKELKIKTGIIDLRVERENDSKLRIDTPDDDKLKDTFLKILELNDIQEFQNIGINCYTSFQYLYVDSLATIIKHEFLDKNIIVGGYHPTAVPKDFTYQNAPYDFILRGESETLLHNLFSYEKLSKRAHMKKPRILTPDTLIDVNNLPPPDYDTYLTKYPYNHVFHFDMYVSRGCPYQCAFCADNYAFRSYNFDIFKEHFSKLIDVVEKTKKKRPKIAFADQSFDRVLINKKVLDYILENEFQERFIFSCQSRIETLANDNELLKQLRKSGFIVGYGFETANKHLLLAMKKTRDPSKYTEMMVKIIHEYKINDGPYCRLNIISGFPGENESSFKETIDFINTYALHESIQISPSLFSNYPNLHVYRNMQYYERRYGTKFINEWWKRLSNPFKSSVCSPSSNYALNSLLCDYKEHYIPILNFFRKSKPEIFTDLVGWKNFYNKWHEELNHFALETRNSSFFSHE